MKIFFLIFLILSLSNFLYADDCDDPNTKVDILESYKKPGRFDVKTS